MKPRNLQNRPRALRWATAALLTTLLTHAFPLASQTAIWKWGKKQDSAERERELGLKLTDFDSAGNAMDQFWSDPEFVKRFMGVYGFNSAIEPKLNTAENGFYLETLGPLLASDPDQAAQALRDYITPDSSALFDFLLGTYFFQQNQHETAVKHFQAALAKFPDFRRAHQNLGFSLVRLQRYEEGARALTRTIQLGGSASDVFGLLGFCYLNTDRFVSAETAYKNATMLDPDNLDWKMGVVRCLIAVENFRPALHMLDEMLAMDPDNKLLWKSKAGIYLQTNEPARAVVSLEFLRKLGAADLKSLSSLGDLYMMQGFASLALPVYREVLLAEGPKDLGLAMRAADIMIERGAHNEAGRLLESARELGMENLPAPKRTELLKMESRLAIATDNGAEAIKVLEEIIQGDPMDGEALLMAGDYYRSVDDVEMAFHRYSLAAKIPEFEADSCLSQAELHVKREQYQKAVELLERAQELQPRDHVAGFLEKVREAASRSVRS